MAGAYEEEGSGAESLYSDSEDSDSEEEEGSGVAGAYEEEGSGAAEPYSDLEGGSGAAGSHGDSEEEEEEEGSETPDTQGISRNREPTKKDLEVAEILANKILGARKRAEVKATLEADKKAAKEQKRKEREVENANAREQRLKDKKQEQEKRKEKQVAKSEKAKEEHAEQHSMLQNVLDEEYGKAWWKTTSPQPIKLRIKLTELPGKLRDVLDEQMQMLDKGEIFAYTQKKLYHNVNISSGTNRGKKLNGWTSYVRNAKLSYYPSNTEHADVGALVVAAATCDWRLSHRRSAHDWLQYMGEQEKNGNGNEAVDRWITDANDTGEKYVNLNRLPSLQKHTGKQASENGPMAMFNRLAARGIFHKEDTNPNPRMRKPDAQNKRSVSRKQQHGAGPSSSKDDAVAREGTVAATRRVYKEKQHGANASSSKDTTDAERPNPSHPTTLECSFAEPRAEVNAVASMVVAPMGGAGAPGTDDDELERVFANFKNMRDGN